MSTPVPYLNFRTIPYIRLTFPNRLNDYDYSICILFRQSHQGNSPYFLCAKIPSKSNRFEEKTNHQRTFGSSAQRKEESALDVSFVRLRTVGSTRLCG
jgi:hypothetical protein